MEYNTCEQASDVQSKMRRYGARGGLAARTRSGLVRERGLAFAGQPHPDPLRYVEGDSETEDGTVEVAVAPREEVIIDVPRTEGDCEICLRKGLRRAYVQVREYAAHLTADHRVQVKYRCVNCGKAYVRQHASAVHSGKCGGVKEVPEADKAFRCEVCAESFGSKIGLGQHERHAHPALRNAKRQGPAPTGEGPMGKRRRLELAWSEEEEGLLVELCCLLDPSDRYPNKTLFPRFPGKTLKQISDKRRLIEGRVLARRRLRIETPGVEPVLRVAPDEGDVPAGSVAPVEDVPNQTASPEGLTAEDWRGRLWQEAGADVPQTARVYEVEQKLLKIVTARRSRDSGHELEEYIRAVLLPYLLSSELEKSGESGTEGGSKRKVGGEEVVVVRGFKRS